MNSCGSIDAVSHSPIDWTVSPNVIKIPANSLTTMLNVTAKLKNSYTMKHVPLKKSLSNEDKGDQISGPTL